MDIYLCLKFTVHETKVFTPPPRHILPFGLLHPKIIWLSNLKFIPEKCRAHWIRYLRFQYYQWVHTSGGGLFVPEGIIRPVVSGYVWNLHFLNNTKVILSQAQVTLTDFGYSF